MKKKHKWSCLTCAAAWMINMDEESLFEAIGHNGSEIKDTALSDPAGRIGFHIQEIIQLVLNRGKSLTPYQLVPQRLVGKTAHPVGGDRRDTFMTLIMDAEGLILCSTPLGYEHAMAFSYGNVFEPDKGTTKTFQLHDGKDILQVFAEYVQYMETLNLIPRELLIYA